MKSYCKPKLTQFFNLISTTDTVFVISVQMYGEAGYGQYHIQTLIYDWVVLWDTARY